MPIADLSHTEFNRKNSLAALGSFFFDRVRYLDMAAEHDTAIALTSADLRAAYEKGTLTTEWYQGMKEQSRAYMLALTASIRSAVLVSSFIMLLVAVAAIAFGLIRPGLTFAPAKLVTVVGGYIALCGGALQLYPAIETNKGEALHERVHGLLTKILFALAATGIFASLM